MRPGVVMEENHIVHENPRALSPDGSSQTCCTLPNIIKAIRSRTSFVEHVACIVIYEMHIKFMSENFRGRDRFEGLGVDAA
jgi:hypothetical protein